MQQNNTLDITVPRKGIVERIRVVSERHGMTRQEALAVAVERLEEWSRMESFVVEMRDIEAIMSDQAGEDERHTAQPRLKIVQ